MESDEERHDWCVRHVRNSGLPEVGVRLRVLDIVWNMRDRASDSDRTGSGNMFYGEIHAPITSDTLRAFADKLEEAALMGIDSQEEDERQKQG